MDIPHKHLSYVGIVDVCLDSLNHTTGSTVGKGQTEHIFVFHTILHVCMLNSLRQYLCLTASRGRKHQVIAAVSPYHPSLTLIGSECIFISHHSLSILSLSLTFDKNTNNNPKTPTHIIKNIKNSSKDEKKSSFSKHTSIIIGIFAQNILIFNQIYYL